LSLAIENGEVGPKDDFKTRARKMEVDYGWDNAEARKIWSFGPDHSGPNCFVDCTKGVAYLLEIKDSITTAVNMATYSAPLTEEQMRGVRFNFLDCQLHADAIHRGGGQIIPTAKKALYAATLRAEPRLQEPVYLVEIQGPQSCVGGVYSCLNTRRGVVINEEFVPGSSRKIIRA